MGVFKNAINRYLGFISAFDDTCNGVKNTSSYYYEFLDNVSPKVYYIPTFWRFL
jgi:hypothetical protein